MGNVVGRIRRFDRIDPANPVSVAQALPEGLRSLNGYLDSDGTAFGYRRYQRDLGDYLEARLGFRPDDGYLSEVAAIAETTMSDWFSEVFDANWRKR